MVKYIFYFFVIGLVLSIPMTCVESCNREKEKQISLSINEALANNDFEKAEALDKNQTHREVILEAEIKYLISLNSPEAAKRLSYKIIEHPCLDVELPNEGIQHGDSKSSTYRENIEKANRWLDGLLDIAIIEKNEEVAKVILTKYLDNLKVEKGPQSIVKNGKKIKLSNDDYFLSYSKDSYQRALEKFKKSKQLW